MEQDKITLNEMFQLVGNYPPVQEERAEPAEKGLTPEEQFSLLKKDIRKFGVIKTAEMAGKFEDRGIRCALGLAAAGIDAMQAKNLMVTAILAGKEGNFKKQLTFNKAVINLVFCLSEIDRGTDKSYRSDVITVEGDLSGRFIYDRTIHVKGRILPGSKVKSGGMVTADGGISGAEIHAAKGVNSPFIEMSAVICQDDILVTSHILNSSVRCAGGIYCSKGSFIQGGSCKAYYTIQADVFGHRSESPTELMLVQSDPKLTVPWDGGKKRDHYINKIVALKKVWKGTSMEIPGNSFYPLKDYDGPVVLEKLLEEDIYDSGN